VDDLLVALDMVHNGDAITFTSEEILARYACRDKLRALPMDTPRKIHMAVATNPQRSLAPPARTLVELLRAQPTDSEVVMPPPSSIPASTRLPPCQRAR
jgi:DNA-binding transcriptional LysR family regulator